MKYTIQKGDTLWGLAYMYLGDSHKWRKIYSYNIETLGMDPDLIFEGTTIIPKHMSDIVCLKNEIQYLSDMADSHNFQYLGRLFKLQDELMTLYILKFIRTLFFIGLGYLVACFIF